MKKEIAMQSLTKGPRPTLTMPEVRDRGAPALIERSIAGGERKQSMKQGVILIVFCLIVGMAASAHAAGTPAGTSITNKATATYTVSGNTVSVDSNTNIVRVAELLNHTLTWQDAAPGVAVAPGQSALAHVKLTNTGNGSDTYFLSATGSGIGGDDFDPLVTGIYVDLNGDGIYTAGTDSVYSAVSGLILPLNGSANLLIMSSVTTTGLVDGNKGNINVTALSAEGAHAPGTVLAGLGEGSPATDAVIGSAGGTQSVTPVYVILSGVVALNKTAAVIDPWGGSQPVPGAVIRYTITATASGTGTAVGVKITDPLPANTTYKPGTLKWNGASLTDGADADKGDVGATTAGTVTVNLGDLTSASPAQVIVFDVTIN